MKTTKEQKKKIVFICFTIIITAFIVITIWQNPALKINNYEKETKQSTVLRQIALCENKIIEDFQIIEPEFQWKENSEEQDSYIWKVTYQESEKQIKITEFECKIWNNWNEVRINRDIENNPNIEDIIYDNRE